jgi:Ca2+-transporting ATPase
LLQGLGILLVTFLLFSYALRSGRSETEARSFAFVSLVFSNLLLIVVNLSWHKNIHRILLSGNKILFSVIAGAIASLFIVLYIPFFSNLFHLAPINFKDLLIIGITSLIGLLWFEILKIFNRKFKQN